MKLGKRLDFNFNLLLAAGIRPVKNNMFPIRCVEDLSECIPEIRLKLVGPVLDEDYAEKFLDCLRNPCTASRGVSRNTMGWSGSMLMRTWY